ncbi:maltooligosyl trehalose synthase [Gordonia araii NBRC 100433]|uniref:Maltooligosyl trehalose synthase n=1 Tax=Gordonia araii NBRC 100433 TaxID=1073574 RepID=G7H2R3_9ACTN|nr:malto-oligosyltrehalose synthase [Gordonia araii]NNG98536.1 malto-oligosyltrehalose synthase [Gordonia araii NBRC 100433]GAB10138.1 maltooligosyl trehalose synthase [Gordonia araii NBRC 100433]
MAKYVGAVATYRVQLGSGFGFPELREALRPIAALGVSHLYLSPILAAMPGSTHGYDWAPPARISPELGGVEGFRRLRQSAARRGLGLIVDIVPQHVGVADPRANPWWEDVLRRGLEAPYAEWFDLLPTPEGVIELPVLGDDGLDAVVLDDAGNLVYHDRVFPTAENTVAPGDSAAAVAARQHYRLVPHASGRYGYRRFTDVSDLAALRVELPEVYEATHGWLLDLVAEDLVDGVRVDHLDGLADPAAYLQRLRADLGPDRLIYVEKMLAPLEHLDSGFPVDGTTGYEQLAVVGAPFTSHAGLRELTELSDFTTGITGDATWMVLEQQRLKREALAVNYAAEHARLAVTLASALGAEAPSIGDLCAVTAELITLMPVTRPDQRDHAGLFREIGNVVADGSPRLRELIPVVVDALEQTPTAAAQIGQLCAAIYTTAVENTLAYRNPRLVSLNELGCQPWLGLPEMSRFHTANAERAQRCPLALSAMTTHDTKRSEDVRTRISLLSQVPQRWALTLAQLTRAAPPPDPATGMFLLQNLFGAWPVDEHGPIQPDEPWRARMREYAVKAVREAGERSSWARPDIAFEERIRAWIDEVTDERVNTPLVDLVTNTFDAWRADATARKVVSLLCPGVGDIYQGSQWWTDSLVDPDNRRPVDYRTSLDHPKCRAIIHALSVRRRHPDAFAPGATYVPVVAVGEAPDRILAFGRGTPDDPDPRIVVACSRHTYSFATEPKESTFLELPAGSWRDRLGDRKFSGKAAIADLLGQESPVVVLERK